MQLRKLEHLKLSTEKYQSIYYNRAPSHTIELTTEKSRNNQSGIRDIQPLGYMNEHVKQTFVCVCID